MSKPRSPDDQRPISSIERHFTRAHISKKDLEQCLSYLNALEKATDPDVRSGLFTAAVIAYARPFSGNKQHRLAEPNAPISLKRLPRDQRALHKCLCYIRNKAIAHSDYELNPSEPREFHTTAFLVKSNFYDPLDEELDVKAFQVLAQAILGAFMGCMHKLAREGAKAGILTPNLEP
jgi:hypothetical protein